MKKAIFGLLVLLAVGYLGVKLGIATTLGDSNNFFGDSAPVEVQTYEKENRFLGPTIVIKYIKITAVADVEIIDIIPNRGNCFVGGVADTKPPNLYKKLQFGQTWDLPIASCSQLLEVEVVTDKGIFKFKF